MESYEVIKEKLEERTGKVFSLREVEKTMDLFLQESQKKAVQAQLSLQFTSIGLRITTMLTRS